jgi:hypothetical protein
MDVEREALLIRLVRWWCELEEGDFSNDIAADFVYEDFVGVHTREEFIGMRSGGLPRWRFELVELWCERDHAAVIYEYADPITGGLWHRFCWTVAFVNDKIDRIVSVWTPADSNIIERPRRTGDAGSERAGEEGASDIKPGKQGEAMAKTDAAVTTLVRWWCKQGDADFSRCLSERFVYETAFERTPRDSFLSSRARSRGYDDLDVRDVWCAERRAAIMFECAETATDQRYRFCWMITFDDGQIASIRACRGDAIKPEDLHPWAQRFANWRRDPRR